MHHDDQIPRHPNRVLYAGRAEVTRIATAGRDRRSRDKNRLSCATSPRLFAHPYMGNLRSARFQPEFPRTLREFARQESRIFPRPISYRRRTVGQVAPAPGMTDRDPKFNGKIRPRQEAVRTATVRERSLRAANPQARRITRSATKKQNRERRNRRISGHPRPSKPDRDPDSPRRRSAAPFVNALRPSPGRTAGFVPVWPLSA
jgi:hypothetical protein